MERNHKNISKNDNTSNNDRDLIRYIVYVIDRCDRARLNEEKMT